MVQTDKLPKPVNVSCNLTGGKTGANAFSLGGKCRAMLLMTREIGANLKRNPASGLYQGIYTGSSSGPAQLRGKQKGDRLDLQVTWGRKIYDDNVARMIIRSTGANSFTMQVVDKINGQQVVVSDLAFNRS